MTQHEQVKASILQAIEDAKYKLPDGPRRNEVIRNLQSALLWLESASVLKIA